MLVMQIVIDRSVDPSADPVPVKSLGIDLIAQVAVHIVNNHDKEKNKEMELMDGNGEKEYNKYACFTKASKG